ncbi:glycoside hydrolase family 13 protein [Xylariaceae sp. FL0016]|nr:glycoside hydrolase family 13 protein [Xylariaceae sp. FL0016]
MSPSTHLPHKWWKEATGYQIYPASFKDANGDGFGDLRGITESLDYLKALGVDFIWISPIYESPNHDMGYDISDYEKISSKYGSMDDMEDLIQQAKARGFRILMDLVVNHTSQDHKWFQESRKSKTNPYSDWYIWRDPRYNDTGERKPPSNWESVFGGSVWTYAPERDQYYFHLCLTEQPDLNWENSDTRRAIYASACEFWLKKGIDGFRVDLVNAYHKESTFPDAPIIDAMKDTQPLKLEWVLNGPRVHEWLREQRTEVLDRYGEDIALIGELPATGHDEVLRYVSADSRELNMTLDFGLFIVGNNYSHRLHELRRHTTVELKDQIAQTQSLVAAGWTTTFLENHDSDRSVDHFGPGEGEYMKPAAKMLALLCTTLSGTLIVYQGQEIGMTNVPKDSWKLDDFKDEMVLRYLREMEEEYPGDEIMKDKAFQASLSRGRDNSRTPMQWSSENPHGGFSIGTSTWLRVNPNYKNVNVASQIEDPDSVLSFWKLAIKSRKLFPDVFVHGRYQVVDRDNEQVFAYWKMSTSGSGAALVLLNFSSNVAKMPSLSLEDRASLRILISSAGEPSDPINADMTPWEGRVFVRR